MRIIDKNRDYYDYLADPTDDVVFDRRDSFLITKDYMCEAFRYSRRYRDHSKFILMQVGASFWLLMAHITEFNEYNNPTDFTLEFIDSWKNYDKPNVLMDINTIMLNHDYFIYNYGTHDYDMAKVKEELPKIREMIDKNDFVQLTDLNSAVSHRSFKGDYITEKFNHPILIASGIPNFIPAEDMYYAIEEYFSIEKTNSEKTVADGTTNNDKIKNHGFDTKTSFRGKA